MGLVSKNISSNRIKYILILLLLLIPLFPSKADAVIIYGDSEVIEKYKDLPDTDAYRINNDFVDIGIKYKVFHVFYVPIDTSEVEYIFSIPNDEDSYYPIEKPNDIFIIARNAGVNIPDVEDISLGFWNEGGGAILIGLLFIAIIGYTYYQKHRDWKSRNSQNREFRRW